MSLNCTTNYLDVEIPSKIKIENLFKKITIYVNSFLKIRANFYFDVTITNSSKILEINKLHRKINKSTDVLSFAFHDTKPKTNLLGEIFIN
jgi:ssRNA-specific RNase YbeY (16S rRNA maturation enzyme)